jgi:YlmC/YmxH family sporulation protein
MNNKQYSFQELAARRVINMADGKELGHTCDIIFSAIGRIMGLVVPGKKSFLKSFTNNDNIFIPWNNIIKIGSDVILVELLGCANICTTEDDPEKERF